MRAEFIITLKVLDNCDYYRKRIKTEIIRSAKMQGLRLSHSIRSHSSCEIEIKILCSYNTIRQIIDSLMFSYTNHISIISIKEESVESSGEQENVSEIVDEFRNWINTLLAGTSTGLAYKAYNETRKKDGKSFRKNEVNDESHPHFFRKIDKVGNYDNQMIQNYVAHWWDD